MTTQLSYQASELAGSIEAWINNLILIIWLTTNTTKKDDCLIFLELQKLKNLIVKL